jgi:MFS transporter, ACS family, D-galactonate transporter
MASDPVRPPEYSLVKKARRRRWIIGWLLGLGVLINYFDRVNLSVSHDALAGAFGISDVTFGILLGAYNWTYALCQMPIGVVLDKLGVRLVGRISTFIWSLASFAAAAAPGIGSFFAARLLLGVGEAPTFPANAKAVGHWFPQEERSFATSLFDTAAKFSSAIGVPLIGILLLRVGWRLSFAATGLISLLYFALFYRVYREPEDDGKLSPEEMAFIRAGKPPQDHRRDHFEEQASLGYLLRQRKVLGLAIGFGSYNYVFYLLLTWLPTYLSQSLHIRLLDSFLYTGVPWLAASVTDLFLGGLLVDRLIQRGWNGNGVRMTVLVGGTALGLGILGCAWAHTARAALIWISVSIGGLSAAAPVGWSMPSLIAPHGSVGRVGGILNFSNQISGIAAPFVTGYLVYKRHTFAGAFAVAGAYLVAGICAYLFMLRNGDPVAPPPIRGNQNWSHP